MYSSEVANHFVINASAYDCCMTISFSGSNKELMRALLERVYLDVEPDKYEFCAFPTDENVTLFERVIFVKVKDT